MKTFAALGFLVIILSCSPPKQFMPARHITIKETDDTSTIVQVVETDVVGRQKSDFNNMIGSWTVTTMRRQQKAELENLSNVYVELKSDSTFSGKGGCNSIGGKFVVKGSGIKFSRIISTKMACDNIDKENAFLALLEDRVSEYTFKGNELLLRDGAANIVFECKRR